MLWATRLMTDSISLCGPGIYVPYTVFVPRFTQILVRSDVPPLSIVNGVRRQIHSVDADQQTEGHVRNLEEWITTQPEWAQQHP